MSRMRDPLNDPGGEDPIDDVPPASEEPAGSPGEDPVGSTVVAAGRPIPIVYGTRKVNALLLEKSQPFFISANFLGRRVATTSYFTGQIKKALAYISPGYTTGQDVVLLCTKSGITSGSADLTGALLHVGQTGIVDGTCIWTLVTIYVTAPVPSAWSASHAYAYRDTCTNDGGKEYTCTVAGTSAGSGGPTGTGYEIADGSATWAYDPAFKVIKAQSILAALCEGEAQGSLQMWWDKERVAADGLTSPGKTLAIQLGTDALGNAVPSPFDTNIDYQHTAIVYGTEVPTGTQAEVPALAFELQGVMFGVTPGHDVSPADIINDLLTHARRGCEWPGSRVDSSITGTGAGGYRVYCDAAGLRLSALLDTQRPAAAWIADILAASNSDAVWSQGKLKVVPLGDQAIASPVFGATGYVPANTSQADLVTNDFLDLDEPVQMSRRSPADCFNSWPIEYVHGSSGSYQLTTIEDPDQSDVDVRGLWRAPTLALPFSFPSGAAPVMLSRIYAQRSLAVRNSYRFRLSWRHLGLEPCDIVTLTEPELGLSATPVRLTSITEDEEGNLLCEAEDYPASAQAATAYTPQAGDGYQSNDRGTAATIPVAVDGAAMGMGVAVVTAAAVAAACVPDAANTRSNFNNLWPNPSSEMAPPTGADETTAEWYGRTFMAPAWIAAHAYAVGDTCTNGGLGYIVTVAGTSAGAGGPTGTGTAIVDGAGTLRWDYESSTVQTGTPYGGNYVRRLDTEQTSFYAPCAEGQVFRISAKGARVSGALGPTVGLAFVDAYDNVLLANTAYSGSTSWTTVSLILTAPANTVRVFCEISDTGGVSVLDAIFAGQESGTASVLTTTGDIPYASAANTLARLAIGSTDQELVVASGLPSWYSGAKKLLDATGALLYASAANTLAKLGIGSSGQVLTVSGGVPTWAAPTGGGWSFATPPASADSRSWEFDSSSLTGLTLHADMSTTTPDEWSDPGANTIRYSVNADGPSAGGRPSHLVMQPDNDGTYRLAIQKAETFNTNDVVTFCWGSNRDQNSAANNDYSGGLILSQSSGGAVDVNNCVKLFLTETDAGQVDIQWEKVIAGAPTTTALSLNAAGTRPVPAVGAIIKRGGDFYFSINLGAGWLRLGSYTGTGLTVDRWGFHVANNSTNYAFQYLDFIRFYANTGNLP